MKTHESEEMYLETIYMLTKRKGVVRSVDIVEELNYAKSSVSRGVNLLQSKGLIKIKENGEIFLTKAGETSASKIYEKHMLITQALTKLGASKELAESNACRIEHVISPEIFELIKKHINSNNI